MPYYGDYYRGDYYRGDPFLGAIGGLIGGLAKRAIPAIGRAVGLVKKVAPKVAAVIRPAAAPAAVSVAVTRASLPAQVAKKRLMLPPPGGAGRGPGVDDMGVMVMRRGKRMNVTNVRALRRAGRRVRGFLKLARRFGALPISPKGKKLYRQPKRAKA